MLRVNSVQAFLMPDLSLVLHGRLGSWLVSATELPGAQRNLSSYRDRHAAKAALKYEQSSRLAAIRAFAAFTHRSLWEHVVLPNRRAGARVRVVMHSWSPEAGDVLDALYEPAASRHEPPPAIDKVSSQHTSMARALALLAGLRGTPDDLVMVARLDLLLYRDVPLAELARTRSSSAPPKVIATTEASVAAAATAAVGPGDAIYLPHTCVPSRMRLPPGQGEAETRVLRRTCSGGSGKERGVPTGRRMLPTQLTRYDPGAVRSLDLPADFTSFVLDYFFIGSPAVAHSFGALAATDPLWWRETPQQWPPKGLAEVASRIRRRFRGKKFPPWAHLYWTEHVANTLVPAGVRLRFLLVHEVDFSLARFWRFGRDCIASVRRSGASSSALHGDLPDGQAGVSGASAVSGGDDAWSTFNNVTQFARSLRGTGQHFLAASPLAEQCPPELERGSHIFCPWFSKACAHQAAGTLAAAEAAGRFQASAHLAPRQLMGAERCATLACLDYNGTARKSGKQKRTRHRAQAMV